MGKKKNVSGMTNSAMLRRIQNMRLMDDELMTVVFSGNIPATELLLRTVLSRDDLKVKSSMTQREKRNLYGRSVRLDIVAEDTAGKRYNVEVQRADKGAAPRRVRYNLAMIDSHTLRRKQDFSVLPETFIIFITENDYLEQGKPFYKVRKVFENTAVDGKGDLPFNDGCTIIYVNGSYRGEDPIGRLMHDFNCRNADDMYYGELASSVRFHKQQDKEVEMVSRIVEEYGDERAKEAKQEDARNMLARNYPLNDIAEITGLSVEDIRVLAASAPEPRA